MVYTAEGQHVSQADLDETVNILNLRVNGLGVSGAQVQTSGKNQISVSIPGVTDAQQVLDQIGQTARMYFRPVECWAYPQAVPKGSKTKVLPTRHRDDPRLYGVVGVDRGQPRRHATARRRATAEQRAPRPPVRGVSLDQRREAQLRQQHVLLPGVNGACDGPPSCAASSGPPQMTGRSIASAQATQNQTGSWVVDYSLAGSAGSKLWDKVARRTSTSCWGSSSTGRCTRRPSSSRPRSAFSSFDGKGEISGNLTQSDAQNLAQAMNFGALPVVLKAATSETVSATLGHSALVAGLGAGIAGLVLVLLYVLFYYRGLGLVVISGLVLTAMMLWAIISALGHTSVAPSFDLAGITGLIVSIGITVDSYIVYFERLKDETRSGRSVRTSVDRGFKSAWRTVWAADFVSLLAAIVLYLVAVGNVKGFAFFLGLSTIMDMAVTWFYTRPLVILLGQSQRLQGTGAFSIATGLGAGPQAQPVPVGAPAGGGGA